MSDTAFVTGGTGFVGANLVRLLLSKGLKVRALTRRNTKSRSLEGLDVEQVYGELSDRNSLKFGTAGAKYVFHCAADYRIWVRDAREMYAANVDGTVNVIEAAAAAGVEKIVHCSSVAAVRPPDGRVPADEESNYGSDEDVISDYKKSKYQSERVALARAAQGVPVVVVNPAAPIGPLDAKPTPTGKVVVDFLNGRIPSYIDTGLNVVHVGDVAEGHWLAALKGRVGQRYILGGENITLKRLLDLLAESTGLPGPSFKTPYAVAYLFGALDTARARMLGGEPLAPLDAVRMARHYMWFDSGKAKHELGFTARPAREALAESANWFLANGYGPKKAVAA